MNNQKENKMIYTLSVSLDLHFICKLRNSIPFYLDFLNVVDTDETLFCDAQKNSPRATYSASQTKCIRQFFK